MHCILWSPLCSISKFSLIKILLETIRFLLKLFPFMRRSIFSFEKQGFQFLKLWSRPKGGPHALHPLVPPLLHFKIFTHQNLARNHPILTKTVSFHEKKHFFIWKTRFSIFEVVVKTKGGTTCIASFGPPFAPFQNFHSLKSCSKPSDYKQNCFLSWEEAFFHWKNKFFNFWSCGQDQRGDHMHCILWSPLCSISKFSLIKILLETIRFLLKLFPFMRKSIFSFEKQGFQFLKLWSRPKGGPHALHPLVPPLLHFKIFTHQNLARNHPILTKTVSFHEKKHFFIWKTRFSIFEVVVKTKGGTTCIASFGPPFAPFQNFHSSKSCSKPSDSKQNCFLSWEEAFFHLKNKFFNFWSCGQDQRGDHMHCILWSPLCSISKFSLIKILLETIRFLLKLFPFMRRSIFSFEKQGFQFLKLWSRPKGGPHALHPLVPPLLHFKIFTKH